MAKTKGRDAERRRELIDRAEARLATDEELRELGVLEAERHAFDAICKRTAPISPIAIGYLWGEMLTHPSVDGPGAMVLHDDLVEYEGERLTILDASRRIAAQGLPAALKDWSGSLGNLGDLAGLVHPRISHDGSESKQQAAHDPEEAETHPIETMSPIHEEKVTAPPVGGNYDLFG